MNVTCFDHFQWANIAQQERKKNNLEWLNNFFFVFAPQCLCFTHCERVSRKRFVHFFFSWMMKWRLISFALFYIHRKTYHDHFWKFHGNIKALTPTFFLICTFLAFFYSFLEEKSCTASWILIHSLDNLLIQLLSTIELIIIANLYTTNISSHACAHFKSSWQFRNFLLLLLLFFVIKLKFFSQFIMKSCDKRPHTLLYGDN